MPRLSKKTMFAIEAVLDVAFHVGEHPVRSGDITERQRIPKRYLEQVLQHLVRAGILADFIRAPEESRSYQADLHAAWPRMNLETVLVDSIIARADGAVALPHYGMPGVLVHERTAHGITDIEGAAQQLGWCDRPAAPVSSSEV